MVVLFAVMVNNGNPPPVPFSETVKVGFVISLVVITRLADSSTVIAGVNVIPIVQLEFAATVPVKPVPHELDATAKSSRFVPAIVKLYVTEVVPALESVTSWGVLSVLSVTVPKTSAVGDTDVEAPKEAVLDHAEVMFGPGVQ